MSALRERGKVIFWALFATWLASFCLPAWRTPGLAGRSGGDQVTALSWPSLQLAFVFIPTTASRGCLNLLMAGARFLVKRVRRGKGRVYIWTFAILALVPAPLLLIEKPPLILGSNGRFLPGFYLWLASLLGMAAWFYLLKAGYWSEGNTAQQKAQLCRA